LAGSRTSDSSTNRDIGDASGAQLVRMRCRSGSNTSLRINSSAADESFANSDGSGLFVANRSGASATQCYRNGASLGSGTAAATTIPGGAGNLFVCAMNPNEANPSIRQQALVFFGGSLTADEVADLYEAFTYYLDAIGAI
jgi:hypothetical protein